jgi:hypothetical protein
MAGGKAIPANKYKEGNKMGEAVERYDGSYGVVNFEDYAMGVESLVKQVALIQDVMSKVMKDGEHYGKIPGTNKPTLLKPGAEKLCMVFRLEPDYEIIREFREDAFIAYTVKCTLKHIPTGQTIASGVGSCNSREEKYRWRYNETPTDKQVPKEYWDARKNGNSKEMKRLIGEGMRTVKVDGVWYVANSQKVENDNPWDLDNTIMKMACKRALVAATLNATAASDIFAQDVEDLPAGTIQEQQQHTNGTGKGKEMKEPGAKSESKQDIKDPDAPATEPQKKAIHAILGNIGVKEDKKHEFCGGLLPVPTTIASMNDITKGQASYIIDKLNNYKVKEGDTIV